ncbi:hypothetical protein F4818DRAFT_306952 [Hypoxylon cercidicola]|nr:hypothetical protein F4818DRAFT_306952 [Hypoxylon cercidicola]
MDLTTSTSSTASSQYGVRTGVWVNWSRGRALGTTITLSNSDGDLAIAFTAFFVGLVASRFWRIACLCFHRVYSSQNPRDALYHQRQVILRNSESAGSGVWSVIGLYWAWRDSTPAMKILVHTIPLMVFSLACVIGFTLASGFSSRISTTVGNQVLIDGSRCGFLAGGGPVKGTWQIDKFTNAANYAQQCYSSSNGSVSGVLDCTLFVTKNLDIVVDESAPCPFKNGICRSDNANLLLDTGYISSDSHLGINSHPDEVIRIRNTLHCAPLVTEGYTSSRTTSTLNYTRYHYGSRAPTTPGNSSRVDYTIEVKDLASQYIENYQHGSTQYNLDALIAATYRNTFHAAESNWNASADLSLPDADVIINFLSGNGILSLGPIDDPWYRMNKTGPEIGYLFSDTKTQAFMPQEAASPMGCAERFQFCNQSQCGPLASLDDAFEYSAPLFGIAESLNEADSWDPLWEKYASNRLATRFLWLGSAYMSYPLTAYEAMSVLGPQVLESRRRLQGSFQGSFQGALPENQWQLDILFWFKTTLASLQTSFVDIAYGTVDPQFAPYTVNITEPSQKDICNNQIINSTQYASFSLLGVLLTYIGGLVIILVSFILEPLLACLQQRRKRKDYALIEWDANEMLQLQRLAQEGSGWGTWSNCAKSIPTTASPEEALGGVDYSNPNHLKLHVSRRTTDLSETTAVFKEDEASVGDETKSRSGAVHVSEKPASVFSRDDGDEASSESNRQP